MKGFLDLLTVWFLTKYCQRPQHCLGMCGLVTLFCAFIAYGVGVVSYIKVWSNPQLTQHFDNMTLALGFVFSFFQPQFVSLLFLGLLFIALGLVAELFVSKTIQPEKGYAVKKRTVECTSNCY